MQKLLTYTLPLLLIGSIILLVLQFRQFGLMWKIENLLFAALGLLVICCAAAARYTIRKYGTLADYTTELALLGISLIPTCLLTAYWLNQSRTGEVVEMPFTFVSEQAYISAPLGMLKNEKHNKKYKLTVKTVNNKLAHFTYEGIARFPLTQPGEQVTLPMRCGLLGTHTIILTAL